MNQWRHLVLVQCFFFITKCYCHPNSILNILNFSLFSKEKKTQNVMNYETRVFLSSLRLFSHTHTQNFIAHSRQHHFFITISARVVFYSKIIIEKHKKKTICCLCVIKCVAIGVFGWRRSKHSLRRTTRQVTTD